jgi:hypothetical protein
MTALPTSRPTISARNAGVSAAAGSRNEPTAGS